MKVGNDLDVQFHAASWSPATILFFHALYCAFFRRSCYPSCLPHSAHLSGPWSNFKPTGMVLRARSGQSAPQGPSGQLPCPRDKLVFIIVAVGGDVAPSTSNISFISLLTWIRFWQIRRTRSAASRHASRYHGAYSGDTDLSTSLAKIALALTDQ